MVHVTKINASATHFSRSLKTHSAISLETCNRLIKFADDTYLIVPEKNSESSAAEIAHIHEWAKKNNLQLNCAKTKELIFRGRGSRSRSSSYDLPPPLQDIERVTSLTVLGVVINDRLTAADHVSGLLTT